MSRADEMNDFVREGLTRYADARDAVDEFEHQVQNRLAEAFEAKADWRNFKAERGPRGRGKPISPGMGSGSTGRYIWVAQSAADEKNGWVDLGLWWRTPCYPDGVVLYCSRWLQGYKIRPVRLDDPAGPVKCGAPDRTKARLYVVLDGKADIGELARLLLDEMDRALGTKESASANTHPPK